MFKNLPNYLKSYLFPNIGKFNKNYFFLQFTSMKIVPAFYIIIKNMINKKIKKNTVVIESSSGNFAYGLALICNFLKLKLVIIGDRGIDDDLHNKLKVLNTKVIIVGNSKTKNIQSLRLKVLNAQLSKHKKNFWPEQYNNPDNINSYKVLKTFLSKKINLKRIDMLVCAVGSGGSSAGFYELIKKYNPKIKLVGVDSVNSVIFGNSLGKRYLRGPGSSIYPQNVKYKLFSKIFWVKDSEAYTVGFNLFKQKGFNSSPCIGAVHLVSNYLNNKYKNKRILAIFPETGERYFKTMYNMKWLIKNKLFNNKINKPQKKISVSQDIKKFSYINWNKMILKK